MKRNWRTILQGSEFKVMRLNDAPMTDTVTDMKTAGKTAKLLPSTAKAAPVAKTAAKGPKPAKGKAPANGGGKTAAEPAAPAAPDPTAAYTR